jgi:hypothetical protein
MISCRNDQAEENGDSNIILPIAHENAHGFTIVWFYTGIELDDNREFLMNLHFKTDNVQTFDQREPCWEHIKYTKHKEVILIITIKHAREVVPILHDLRQLDSIYVYDLCALSGQAWMHRYVKVSYYVVLLTMEPDVAAIANLHSRIQII